MKPTRSTRPTLRQLISAFSLSAMLFAQNASAFTIAQNPPFLPTPLPPNIVMTFDDSGSMRWAYAPDGLCGDHATRRAKSAAYNPLYYNPSLRYDPPVKYNAASATYSEYTTSFTAAKVNGFNDGHGTVNLSTSYRPTWSKDPATSTQNEIGANAPSCSSNTNKLYNQFAGNPTQEYEYYQTGPKTFENRVRAGVPAYYYVYDPSFTKCSSPALSNDNCYRHVVVSATSGPGNFDLNGDGTIDAADKDEQQNFANWYSFYRTRTLMTATSATRALVGVPPTARLGWQSINSCNATDNNFFTSSCAGSDGVNRDKRLKVFDSTHRENMFLWMSRLPANGGTALRSAMRRAGDYFRTSGVNSPYAINPTVTQGTEYSCRPNFHILMTDGIWNNDSNSSDYCGGDSDSTCGNKDNNKLTLPDGKEYAPRNPFRDSYSNNVADIAFHYWATDLRPGAGMPNNLMPYRVDRTGTEEEQYWNPKNDPATWQHMVTFTVGLGLSKTFSLDGLPWGGSTYEGQGYANLVSGARSWPETGIDQSPGNVYDLWHAAINSRGQSFSADTPRDLSDALATALNRILERESAAAALATNSTRLATDTLLFQARFFSGTWTGALTAYAINTDGSVGNVQWEATAPGKIPAHGSRKIFTWNGISNAGTTFDESGLNSAGLWSSIGSTALLNYLRGDTSNENPSGLRYRARGGPLGDIVNSDPAFVATENFGYTALASEGSSYPAFLAAKKSRTKMLYVGSNDGFLRAFNALTGEEMFAYVPNGIVADLPQLADVDYAHRFYVDGAPAAWDAYFNSGWKTVLTGTTGAGGRSVFALDVTNPSSFGASSVLWEINQNTGTRTGDAADPQYGARLGSTIGQAVVVRLNNGEWAAVFGNGYRSPGSVSPSIPGDQASLYIVRVSDGTLIRRIDTGFGSLGAPNGLGTPTLFDVNGDEIADVAYAPDMRGNVWKFDLGNGTASAWDVAYKSGSTNLPLFQAVNSLGSFQPISARIELASPPPGKSGIMVLFGTGRFFAVGDNTDATGQTFYGIWDNGSAITSTNRSTLQAQTISTETIDLRGVSTVVRKVTSDPIDWATKRGWYIDLPTSMERVIGSAAVRDNRVIFTTLIPSTDPCVFGGSGWLMEVSATTGAQLPYAVFDTNGDKLVTADDRIIAGVPLAVGMVKRPLVIDGSPVAAKFLSGTTSEIQIERNRTFGPPLGRESWREVQR